MIYLLIPLSIVLCYGIYKGCKRRDRLDAEDAAAYKMKQCWQMSKGEE